MISPAEALTVVPEKTVAFGVPRLARFSKLKNSARNCNLKRSESAVFLNTDMSTSANEAFETARWDGLSVLYLCPLKALLNNLLPRLETYASWLGRRAALWHGDTTSSTRRSVQIAPPDLLLTTPESLESMLVSPKVDHHRLFNGLRAAVVDEVHAFGGDDRGWHLLAVLERLTRITGRPIQRIGLSATVGNPGQLLHWLQGSAAQRRPGTVVNPEVKGKKLEIGKFRRRKNSRRHTGHRQKYTSVQITAITVPGLEIVEKPAEEKKAEKKTPAKKTPEKKASEKKDE